MAILYSVKFAVQSGVQSETEANTVIKPFICPVLSQEEASLTPQKKEAYRNTVIYPVKPQLNTVMLLPPEPDDDNTATTRTFVDSNDEEDVKLVHKGEEVSDKRTFTVFLNGKPLGKYC